MIASKLAASVSATALALSTISTPAVADYPERVVRLIVPFAAGGSADTLARIVAQGLGRELGKDVVVENMPGAGGEIGTARLISSNADGYVIGVCLDGLSATIPMAKVVQGVTPAYNPLDLTLVGLVANVGFVVVVRNDLPVKTAQELVTYLTHTRARVGVSTPTARLVTALLRMRGALLDEIPSPSEAASHADLGRGDIELIVSTTTSAVPFVEVGHERTIGVLGSVPQPLLPNVPLLAATFPEFGGIVGDTWGGICMPRSVAREVVARLRTSLAQALDSTAKARLEAIGWVVRDSPADPDEFLRDYIKRMKEFLESTGVRLPVGP